MTTNETYSFKDFTGQSLTLIPVDDLTGDIIGTCFAQEKPNTVIFPNNMEAVFKRCNLDNVVIPGGCAVESADGIDSSQRKYEAQNDLEDWEVDENLNPIEPINKARFIALALSTDPKDIPIEKMTTESITEQKEREIREAE